MSRFFKVLIILMVAWQTCAQAGAPIRLAIVPESTELATAADCLTVDLSKRDGLQLLERSEIEKVRREQALAATGLNDLKLGQILGADGVLILEAGKGETNTLLSVRLVAVKPGVLLSEVHFDWPLVDPVQWASGVSRHFGPFFPKLAVPAKAAIPLSILNLRSALQSDTASDLERRLTWLIISRLSREQPLFVLERRKMELLTAEKELPGMEDSAFWDGSYLLDGILDKEGYAPDTITISARLVPPRGGAPVAIAASGSRTNEMEVINRLADHVLAALKLEKSQVSWNPADEAEQFFAEAKWAMKWGLYPQAQTAVESAWALGKQDAETAAFRIRTYSESMPLNSPHVSGPTEHDFSTEISVSSMPDPGRLPVLDRALQTFSEDAPLLFADDQNATNFGMGVQLLRRTAGLLESYYFAPEQRGGHEEQLAALRQRMRDAMMVMDARFILTTNDFSRANSDPKLTYNGLKWEVGGIARERPEDNLPVLRQLVQTGYVPKHLPQLAGWSWPDRQRTPELMRQLIDGLCTDTNPAANVTGRFLALQLGAVDEAGSLRQREQELIAALWENRQWLYQSVENINLIESFVRVLNEKYGYPHKFIGDGQYQYFDHEPFASFYHRLRMDFLQQAGPVDHKVFWSLFVNTPRTMETPAQARELLPLVLARQQKYPPTNSWYWAMQKLNQTAGLADPSSAKLFSAAPVQPAGDVLDVKFIPWQLLRPGIEPGWQPMFRRMVVNGGKMWMLAQYQDMGSGTPLWDQNAQTTYVEVDPQRGVQVEIPFPPQLGEVDQVLEVSGDSIFIIAHGKLYRCRLPGGSWVEVPAPMDRVTQLIRINDRLFACRDDGLLEVRLNTKSVRLLVSSRRQPAVNEIDPLWTSQCKIYPRPDGRLGVISKDHSLIFDPENGHWSCRAIPLTNGGNHYYFKSAFIAGDGAECLLAETEWWSLLMGFWNDEGSPELLLTAPSLYQAWNPQPKPNLPLGRWEWPSVFPLAGARILAEGKTLALICPRKTWPSDYLPYDTGREAVKFSDNRQATLFYFEPQFRLPLQIPLHFEDNGRSEDLFFPRKGGFHQSQDVEDSFNENAMFWMKTPAGLVLSIPAYRGHWLIPNAVLEARLQVQRQVLRAQTNAAVAGPLAPHTP